MKTAEVLIAIVLATVVPAWTQDASSGSTGSAPPVAATVAGQPTTSADEMTPDTQPLTGASWFTLGIPADQRNQFNAMLFVNQSVATNQVSLGGTGDIGAGLNLAGTVSLQHFGPRSTTNLSYTSGGWLSETAGFGSNYQQLSINQNFLFRRWSLMLSDFTNYTPATFFGLPGAGLSNGTLNNTVVPTQSILIGEPLMSNTTLGQVTYEVTPRASLTAMGSIGFLDVLNLGTDSRQETFSLGYNYALTEADTVAPFYTIQFTQFPGQSANFTTHMINGAYGRRLTGRMALQTSAGAQILTFGSAPTTNSSGAAASTSIPTWVTWDANAALIYKLSQGTVNVTFAHGVNSGSGVLLGASGNAVLVGWSRPIGQKLMANLTGSYAHNAALQQFVGLSVPVGASFNSEFAALGLQYPITPSVSLMFNYNMQHQSSNVPLCIGPCSNSLLQHFVMVGFQWSLRPRQTVNQ